MNKVILMGRLVRDPEVRYSGEMAVARFTLAVDRKFKQGGESSADFISCVSFGKAAEFAEKYLHKGIKIAITGRIQTGSYTNKDGQRVYTTDVVVEEQEFCESKTIGTDGSGDAPTGRGPERTTTGRSASAPYTTGSDGFINIPDGIDEELPFN